MIRRVDVARSASPAPSYVPPPSPLRTSVAFQYTGTTSLSAIGPLSGRRYHFDRPGAVVEVDPRDRVSLTTVPNLKQV